MSKRVNTSDRVAQVIRDNISEAKLRPGDRLPSIDQLAQNTQVSRSTVREALQKLAALGVVSMHQGIGTTVAKLDLDELIKSVSGLMADEGISLEEIIQVRKLFEEANIKIVVQRASNEEIGELIPTREDFLLQVAQLAGNSLLAHLYNLVWQLYVATLGRKIASPSYQSIWEAMQARNAQRAVELMKTQLDEILESQIQQDLTIYCDAFGTGSIGGSFYNLGQATAQIISSHTGLRPSIQPTGGGIENIRLAEDGKISLGIAQVDVALDAYSGKGLFSYPHANLRVICALSGLDLQIFTLATSGITQLSQLKGKTLALGAHGGASVNVAKTVLRAYGFMEMQDFLPQNLPLMQAIEMLKEGTIDGVFCLSAGQSPALVELALTHDLCFLAVETAQAENLKKMYPYWYKSQIIAQTYPNQNNGVATIGVPTILLTHKDVSISHVYDITKVVFEQGSHLGFYPLEQELGIPYHPGALRFFREKRYR